MSFYGKRICFLLMLSAVLLTSVVFAGCKGMPEASKAQDGSGTSASSVDSKVEEVLASMSLTEKLGQMVMIGIGNPSADQDALYMLHQFHFGGVILFDRNMESKEQVAKLTADLQKGAEEKVPLFIAIDEEGGRVARMKEKLAPPPSQLSIGQTGDPKNAEKWAISISKELKAMGINVNFAPVADLGSFKERHYSEDPETVAAFVNAAADGYEAEGEFYSLKHFPGIGKGQTDTHLDMVVVDAPKETLMAEDVLPFQSVIKSRKPENYFVMVSHIIYPQISGDVPSSLSESVMTGLLRKELGFDGIIITDDMEMGAIAKYYGTREIGVKAVKAGADIVMVCQEYPHQEDVYMGLLEAVKAGEIPEERVNASVRRILKAKLSHLN